MGSADVTNIFALDEEADYLLNSGDSSRSPEERLLYAVLERAIRDFIGGASSDAADAREWLSAPGSNHNDNEPFSFVWVCEFLGLDSADVRMRLERTLQQSKDGKLPFFLDKRFVDTSNTRPRRGGRSKKVSNPVSLPAECECQAA